MLKSILFSGVLIGLLTVGSEVQSADACGINPTLAKSKRAKPTKHSANPSKILIVGSRDEKLEKKLRFAHHRTEFAVSVSKAKHKHYDLIIADGKEFDLARARFGKTLVLSKMSTSTSTIAVAETMLARSAVGNSGRRDRVDASSEQRPVATGSEPGKGDPQGKGDRKPSDSGQEIAYLTVDKTAPADTKADKKIVEQKAEELESVVSTRPQERASDAARWTSTFHFGSNRTELAGSALRRVKENAVWLQKHPGTSLVIEGHTDSAGSEAYNADLSERRAKVARDLMISMGVDASRIQVDGKGESDPVFTPSTSGKNRRIVMVKK